MKTLKDLILQFYFILWTKRGDQPLFKLPTDQANKQFGKIIWQDLNETIKIFI